MGKKIFISYKYADSDVKPLDREYAKGTVRDYVDEIRKNYLDDTDIYKGEEDANDLSDFKESTIETKLKDKIYDSSITIVLISPNMKENIDENDQWIPWEISYSLKKNNKNNRTSQHNGIVAIILPNSAGNYEYFIKDSDCGPNCCIQYQTHETFEIIKNNIHNKKSGTSSWCNVLKKKYFWGCTI